MELGNSMLGDFGGIREDLIGILALGYGGDRSKASAKIGELESLIRSEAKKGALEATPNIRTEVRKEVTPYVYIALGLGVLGLLVGVGTIIYVRRKS